MLLASLLAADSVEAAGQDREPVAAGEFALPAPAGSTVVAGVSSKAVDLWVKAALDLAPFRDLIESRYKTSAQVTAFRQQPAFLIPRSGGDGPIHARDFAVTLRLNIDSGAAQMALKTGKTLDATFRGRLLAGVLEGDGGCGSGRRGLALALLVLDAPPFVRDEFAGFTARVCLSPREQRQCIVNTLDDGQVVERCYPTTPTAKFDAAVCNRGFLDKKRGMLTRPGAVTCHRRWVDFRATWNFELMPGARPSAWYSGFIKSGLRAYGGVVLTLLAKRYRAAWRASDAPAHGSIL